MHKKRSNQKNILTEHEIVLLKDSYKTKRELALIDFLNSTGVRVSECASLKLNDVNFVSGKCNIYSTKTKSWRTVFLDADALKHLTDYRIELAKNDSANSEYVFCAERKRKKQGSLSNATIEKIIKNVKCRADINKKITVHTFRKTFASRCNRKGLQPTSIAMLLGHTDFSTTAKYYVEINKNDLENEYDRCMN